MQWRWREEQQKAYGSDPSKIRPPPTLRRYLLGDRTHVSLEVDCGTVGRCDALLRRGMGRLCTVTRHHTGLNYGDYIGIRRGATGHAQRRDRTCAILPMERDRTCEDRKSCPQAGARPDMRIAGSVGGRDRTCAHSSSGFDPVRDRICAHYQSTLVITLIVDITPSTWRARGD